MRATASGYSLLAASGGNATLDDEQLLMVPDTLAVLVRSPTSPATGEGRSGRRSGAPCPAGPTPWTWTPA